jgi:NAD-dependent DNA ligase
MELDKMGIEKACQETVDNSINMTVPWYLMASYAYYEEDDPILEDRTFDILGKRILDHWEDIDHRHKDYLSKDMLKAGTFEGKYPSQIQGALKSVRETYTDKEGVK